MQYFIKRGDKVSGPFTAEQVKTAQKLEKLKPEDLLGASDDGPWKELRSVFKVKADSSDSLKVSSPSVSALPSDANVEQSPSIVSYELPPADVIHDEWLDTEAARVSAEPPPADGIQGKTFSTGTSLKAWEDVTPQQTAASHDDSSVQSNAGHSALARAQREVARQEREAAPDVTGLKIAGAICWALGALLLTQIGCFGLLGVWPMTLLTKHYYDNGDGLKALCFLVATVISAILAIVWFIVAFDYISKVAGNFWSAVF